VTGPVRYPLAVTCPDGSEVRCHDGEHAAAAWLLTAPLLWPKLGRVTDRHGDVDWDLVDARLAGASSGERLLADAARDLYGAWGAQPPPTLRRLCEVLDTRHLRRVLEAVCLLRPDADPLGGWGQ
jgi:hypothetical protein